MFKNEPTENMQKHMLKCLLTTEEKIFTFKLKAQAMYVTKYSS